MFCFWQPSSRYILKAKWYEYSYNTFQTAILAAIYILIFIYILTITKIISMLLYNRRKICLNHISAEKPDMPIHVITYVKWSFCSDIMVWPPIGPPGTDDSMIASRNTGAAPVTLHISSKSLAKKKYNQIFLRLSRDVHCSCLPICEMVCGLLRRELWTLFAFPNETSYLNGAVDLTFLASIRPDVMPWHPSAVDKDDFSVGENNSHMKWV